MMKDAVEQEVKPEIYLHENLTSSRYYCGQAFNFHKAEGDDSEKFFGYQQHFSDGFVNFIDTVKQIRFELQTGQINNHEAYDRLTQAEDDNGLPTVAYMDTNGIQMSGHVENIRTFFGNTHDAPVKIYYDMQGQLDGGDRRAVYREVDTNHDKNIGFLAEVLDVHAEAVKAYDHDQVVVKATEALATTC